jgi:hypothetical protein
MASGASIGAGTSVMSYEMQGGVVDASLALKMINDHTHTSRDTSLDYIIFSARELYHNAYSDLNNNEWHLQAEN